MRVEVERVALTAVLLAAVTTVLAASAGLGPVARLAPVVVAVPTWALLCLELVADLMGARGHRPDLLEVKGIAGRVRGVAAKPSIGPAGPRREETRTLLWLALLVALAWLAGMVSGLAVYLALYLGRRTSIGWPISIALGVVFGLVLFAGLEGLLGVRLYGGVAAGRLG